MSLTPKKKACIFLIDATGSCFLIDQFVIYFCETLVYVNTPSTLISGISCLDKQVPLFDCDKNMDEDARLLCVFAKI